MRLSKRWKQSWAAQPEVINYVSTVGISGPIDFNGMVRHYYLRSRPNQAEIRVNFVARSIESCKAMVSGCDCGMNLPR